MVLFAQFSPVCLLSLKTRETWQMYKVRKRKEFEDVIRRQRQNIGSWAWQPSHFGIQSCEWASEQVGFDFNIFFNFQDICPERIELIVESKETSFPSIACIKRYYVS